MLLLNLLMFLFKFKENVLRDNMAEHNKKGTVNNYTGMSVKKKEYYYDREETDKDLQKDFGDMLFDLKTFNKKLQKELHKEKPAKLEIDKE